MCTNIQCIYNTGSILCPTPRCEVMHTPMGAWALEVHEFGFSSALFWGLYLYLPPAGFCLLTLFLMVRIIPLCYQFTDIIPFTEQKPKYPGVGLFLQNIFIFVASLLFKFGRSEDMWG
jgi:hypothetical protein